MGYKTKDSGERVRYETGAQRDSENTKPRYDLIPVEPLYRLAELYQRGADKYDDDNWRKGIPLKRLYGSLFRHLQQWALGDRTEDHLAAVAWNAFSLMWTEEAIALGKVPQSFANFGPLAEDQPQDENDQEDVNHVEAPFMSLGQKAYEEWGKTIIADSPGGMRPIPWPHLYTPAQVAWENAAQIIVRSLSEVKLSSTPKARTL